jgi:hypothetical protein
MIALLLSGQTLSAKVLPNPLNLQVYNRHLRIDLTWEIPQKGVEFEIERAEHPQGPFHHVARHLNTIPVYSDYIGEAGKTLYYRVRAVSKVSLREACTSEWVGPMAGTSIEASKEEFLTEIQEANFRYFWDFAHPVSGLAREGTEHPPEVVAIGASGMGCFNIAVGIERGFITREQGAERALKILHFLSYKAERFHGAFPHWMDGASGKVIPFNEHDDGADLVETAFLIEGILFWREYFTGESKTEREIRRLCNQLWLDVEWDWFVRKRENGLYMMWHWSPTIGWRKLPIWGFTECHVAYVLALASPTHPIPLECYRNAWDNGHDANKPREWFGIPIATYREYGCPLFFLHYSYMGLEPRAFKMTSDRTYFDEFVNICNIQMRYAESRQDDFIGYGPLWGLTASIDPDGYKAHRPGKNDNGTITPTAAMASMPYVPEESLAFTQLLYKNYGPKLWGEFAFYDAFNPTRKWIGKHYLGIDVGPIAPMIENHRTGLGWRYFMAAEEIVKAVELLR